MTRRPAEEPRRTGTAGDARPRRGAAPAADPQPEPQRSARGHAHLAASARRTLGVQVTVAQRVADVPAPLFSAVVAAAAAVVAVLLRPQRTPRGLGLPLEAALVAVCAAAIIVQARAGARHADAAARGGGVGVGAALLAVGAMCSLFVALAGSDSWAVTVPAALLCAAVVALSSHLDSLRAAGREGGRERVLRDAAGTVVMIPVALAGASDSLAAAPRAAVVLLGAGLLIVAATAPARWRRFVLPGAVAGLLTALATLLAVHASSPATGAAGLLLLWYGLRGLATVAPGWPRERMALVEYLAVSAGAVALLVTQARG
jgi:hypothetical protein